MPRLIARLVVGAGLLLGGPASAVALGVDAVFDPADASVTSGEQFTLDVVVPDTSASFNAFELDVEFDPASLALVSYQEGPLMTGACGNRFHVPSAGSGTFTVTDGLLCPGTKVHGPGTLYTLRFQAVADGAITTVILRGAGFSDAGITVTPVHTGNAVVRIGDVTGIPGDDPDGRRIALGPPYPNPASGAVAFDLDPGEAGPVRVEIFAVTGRRVRTILDGGDAASAPRRLTWNGTDERGLSAPPGIYFVRMSAGDRSWTRRVVRTP